MLPCGSSSPRGLLSTDAVWEWKTLILTQEIEISHLLHLSNSLILFFSSLVSMVFRVKPIRVPNCSLRHPFMRRWSGCSRPAENWPLSIWRKSSVLNTKTARWRRRALETNMKARVGLSLPGRIIRNCMFDQYRATQPFWNSQDSFTSVYWLLRSIELKNIYIPLPGLFCFCSFTHFTYFSVKEISSEFKMQFSDADLIYLGKKATQTNMDLFEKVSEPLFNLELIIITTFIWNIL